MNRRALDLALGLAHALDHARVHEVATLIERALEHVQLLESRLQEDVPTRTLRNSTLAPGRVVRGLIALAVRVLPARDQPRYAEEFRTELVELRRRYRLGHAVRVLGRAWELRRALTEMGGAPDRIPVRRAPEW